MAGHSKWANIKHRKARQDAKRGAVFTKVIRELTVAAKEGGGVVEDNPRLRLAYEKALSANMGKDTINRAIQRGAGGQEGQNLEEVIYEGYGPEGIAVFIKTLTDNKNRTASNIRTIFQKSGGSLGTQGSASHNFSQLGIIKVDKNEISEEDILELAIDAGANECKSYKEFHEIQCSINDIYDVKKELEKKIGNFISTGIEWVPLNAVKISDERKEELINFFETLEEDDDVQNIYSNVKFSN